MYKPIGIFSSLQPLPRSLERTFRSARILTFCGAFTFLPTSVLADAPLGLCLNWLEGVPNGQSLESCARPLQDHYQSDISETRRLRLQQLARAQGLDLFSNAGEPETSVSFGHIRLVEAPENPAVVDGPSLIETLEYLSQLTLPERSGIVAIPFGDDVTTRIDVSIELTQCWFEVHERTYCGSNLMVHERRGFDLREADVRVTELSRYDLPQLLRADRRVYPQTSTRYGRCNGGEVFERLDAPTEGQVNQAFSIHMGLIRDRRDDYAVQIQRSLLHLARICGATEEEVLFE